MQFPLASLRAAPRFQLWLLGLSVQSSSDPRRIPVVRKHPLPIVTNSLNVNVSFLYVCFPFFPRRTQLLDTKTSELSSHPAEQRLHNKHFPLKYHCWKPLFVKCPQFIIHRLEPLQILPLSSPTLGVKVLKEGMTLDTWEYSTMNK